MKLENGRAADVRVAYIGGGSRGWAWTLMQDLALEPSMEGTVLLYDIDRAAARTNEIIGRRLSAHPQALSRWQYQAVETLDQALTGADFVVISILPGTFEEMRADVHLPEAFGIWQSVGDTTGPGGLMRALRTVPMFRTFAEAIRRCCPDAWVINYTNPMAACIGALYSVFPGIRAFGCCHEVFGTQELLADMLRVEHGAGMVPRSEIKVNVKGINHFTWFDRASWRGRDLLPDYRAFAERYYRTGFTEGRGGNWMNDSFAFAHRVKFDLFLRYGLVAAAGDRHLAEFLPHWYLRRASTPSEWMFGMTTVDWRVEDLSRRLARARRLAEGTEALPLEHSGEEGHLLMKALLGLGDLVSNVNLPNRGQTPDLPLGAVVETNALFGANGIYPVMAGTLPADVRGLVLPHANNQQSIVEAALQEDRGLAFNTFLNDPQLAGLTVSRARELFDRMMHATAAYLPEGLLTAAEKNSR